MVKLDMTHHLFREATPVVLEASEQVICEHHLNTYENEHFDVIRDVLSITVTPDAVVLATCRTIEDWSRSTWTFPRGHVAALYVAEDDA